MGTLVFDAVEVMGAKETPHLTPSGASGAKWTQRSRATLWLTLLFWLSNYIVLMFGYVVEGRAQLLELASIRAGLTGAGLGLCYLMHLALAGLAARSFKRRAFVAAILAPIAAELIAWANYYALGHVQPARGAQAIDWSQAFFTIAIWTWFFLAWAGLYLALQYSYDAKEEQQRSSELAVRAHEAKLRALHNQINPHFLFNSLNSVSALVADGRTSDADEMIGKLSSFLRMTLALDPTKDIALSAEIGLQQVYLGIERLRYPDLRVHIDLPDALAGAAVPTLILQPIIENAVKYGVAGSPPPAEIIIRASSNPRGLRLEVVDSGRALPSSASSGGGMGLRNVQERLSQRFGSCHSFTAGRTSAGSYCVALEMPLELVR